VVPLANTPSAPTSDCLAGVCDAATLANWDISQWGTTIASLGLPGASWQINQTTIGNPSTYTIVIYWTDRRSDTAYAAYNAASSVGVNQFENAEMFSYTATRTISN
jgi:hypothetical protein